MSDYVSSEMRRTVAERAQFRCEYCGLRQSNSSIKHEIEHTLPRQHGGETVLDNLALSCFDCNRYKGTNVASYDTESGELTPLFNPRTQVWLEHFYLDGAVFMPLTAIARVTIRILRLNDQRRVEERRALIEAGIY